MRFFKKISGLIKQTEAKRIIDVGCGEGFVEKYLLRENPKLETIGIDKSKKAIEIARKRSPKTKFWVGDIYSLPFPKNSFDLVLALEILEHLEKPNQAIEELKRVSKKWCLISVPNEPLFSLLTLLQGRYLKRLGQHPEHIQFWSRSKFEKFLNLFFKKVKIYSVFPWLVALCEK